MEIRFEWRKSVDDIQQKREKIKRMEEELADMKRRSRVREDSIIVTDVTIMIMRMIVKGPWSKENIDACARKIVAYLREHIV